MAPVFREQQSSLPYFAAMIANTLPRRRPSRYSWLDVFGSTTAHSPRVSSPLLILTGRLRTELRQMVGWAK